MTEPPTATTKVAVIGSGNIGTDLMIRVLRLSDTLFVGAMVGIDPGSDGLACGVRMGVPTTSNGVAALIDVADFEEIDIIFDATSAKAHIANAAALAPYGKRLIDLTGVYSSFLRHAETASSPTTSACANLLSKSAVSVSPADRKT